MDEAGRASKRARDRDAWRWRYYGIAPSDFDRLAGEQGDCCAICELKPSDPRDLRIDHDHRTGAVRGLLCVKCNTGLGMLGDDLAGLTKALEYLKRAQK